MSQLILVKNTLNPLCLTKCSARGWLWLKKQRLILTGPGRKDSKDLVRPASLTYATESMRLTTRLMQLASWLLLQRAVKEGEMTTEEVLQEKYRIKLEELGPANVDGADKLPEGLKGLIAHSLRASRTRFCAWTICCAPKPASGQQQIMP